MSKKSEVINEEVSNEEQINETPNAEETVNEEGNTEETNASEPEATEESELELLKNQVKEANDKYLRLYSDFENFRRRNSRERLELIQSAGADIIKEMLPIMDDFERAAISNKDAKDVTPVIEGFALIQNKLGNLLTNKGLTPMDTQVGADFDTDKHEAITNIPAPSPELSGKVVDIVEKGYLLNDKVIRYAKVVVGQ